jgi:hypothetical protein
MNQFDGKLNFFMDIQSFERLIEGRTESVSLDFKADSPWSVKGLGRDILAMSNVRNGGTIVIGINEEGNSFVRKGVCEANKHSYKIDIMKDQLLKYADPAVDFSVSFPQDSNGLDYVVITVYPFKEVPTICKKELDKELKPNTIYYRNTDRRIESAAISNSNDLRDLVELAAIRLMQRRRDWGYILPDQNLEIFKNEIETIIETPLIGKIRSRGYIETQIIPNKPENISSLSKCLKYIKDAQVSFYWSLPWIPVNGTGQGTLHPADGSYEGESDLGARLEFWRFFESGQFYMLNSIVEDWYAEDPLRQSWTDVVPGKYLSLITSIVHYITQLFAFLERLALQGLYKEGVQVSITYIGTKERELYIDSSKRINFITPKITKADKIQLKGNFTYEEITQDNLKLANAIILKALDYFGFNPPPDSIQIEQLELLNRRY